MKKLWLLAFALLSVCSFVVKGQSPKMPSTPRNLWAGVFVNVLDSCRDTPVSAHFQLRREKDSSVIDEGSTYCERWTADDGEHETESVAVILPDFNDSYLLEVMSDGYKTNVQRIDLSDKITESSPMEEREIRLPAIKLQESIKQKSK